MTNPLITSDPDVIGGQPRIAGTRISVAIIMGWVNQGAGHAEIIEAFPDLTGEQIDAAIRYAAIVDVSPMTNPVSQEEALRALDILRLGRDIGNRQVATLRAFISQQLQAREYFGIWYNGHVAPTCMFGTKDCAEAYWRDEMGEDGTGAYSVKATSVFLPSPPSEGTL